MLKAFVLIVVGLAGDPEHGELFAKWGTSLAESSAKVGVTPDRLIHLADKKATRDEVTSALATFAAAAGPDDVVYVVLFGHGTFDGTTARYNLTGPDMTPADFNNVLRKLPTRNIVFVNTASASAPFVDELSGPGRTIVTATRTGGQHFATLFGGYFVEALTSEAADADKNKRVSVLEAFLYAKTEVKRAYDREGFLNAFVERMEKNFRDAGQPWSTDVAAAVRSYGEGRWTDIRAILDTAEAAP